MSKIKQTQRPPRHRGPGGMGPVEHAKDFGGTIKKILVTLDREKYFVIAAFIFSIASTIFAIYGPKILGNATQKIYEGAVAKISGTGSIDIGRVHAILKSALLLYVISAFCNYFQSYLMSIATQKYTFRIRNMMEEKLHKLPFSYFDNNQRGETLSLFTNDVDNMQICFNQALTQAITSITTVIGVLVMMISINVQMTLVALLILPLSLIFVINIVKKSQKYFALNQTNLGHVNGSIEEMFSGHNIVKTFNAEERMLKEFNKSNKNLRESGWKSQFLGGLMHPIMISISNLGYVGIAIVGGWNIIKGNINVGNLQSFITYSKNFTQPITSLAQVFNQIQSMVASAERIFEFLDKKEIKENKSAYELPEIKGDVEFKNVSFGYDDTKIIINNFSAKVKSGEKVAIVGPTGAGKTTMVKLLMHFYDINSGSILVDNHDINDITLSSLRSNISMVLQDTWLFNGTIKDNLKYGCPDATDQEVIIAAKQANVHNFIMTLPDKYDTIIDEETSNISQGQKQLLTIARAILADSKILILDEATSSVDTRTEELIQESMDKLMDGRTSFVIAHRLSTIRNADLILVMDKGDIVESGTHDELLKKKGFYANLYNSQFEK
ncbi:MAG: ABC transporter ATP-binding protein/permease [Bacilli bacterium]|nr:ABC transporter ATP-binding protein/permease [Bacilli bacterium]